MARNKTGTPDPVESAPRTVSEYLHDKPPEVARLFRRFERLVHSCGRVNTRVHRTVVYWTRARVFCGAFIISSKYLELVIDLRREAQHPCLVAAFPTTRTVITHRLRIASADQLDAELENLLLEAYDTVGPGFRQKAKTP